MNILLFSSLGFLAGLCCLICLLLAFAASLERDLRFLRWWAFSWLANGLSLLLGVVLGAHVLGSGDRLLAERIALAVCLISALQAVFLFASVGELWLGRLGAGFRAGLAILGCTLLVICVVYSSPEVVIGSGNPFFFFRSLSAALGTAGLVYCMFRRFGTNHGAALNSCFLFAALYSLHQLLNALQFLGLTVYSRVHSASSILIGAGLSLGLVISFLIYSARLARRRLLELERIWNSPHVGLALFDPQHRLLRANRFFQEVVGPHASDLAEAGGTVALPNGAMLDVFTSPLETGLHPTTLCLVRDQTALVRAEERYRRALDSVQDVYFEWHLATGSIEISPRYFEMLGFPPDGLSVNHASFLDRLHPDDIAAVDAAWRSYLTSPHIGPFETEYRLRRADGTYAWILARGKAIVHEATAVPVAIVGTLSEVTRRKVIEAELAAALTRAEQAAETKSQFLANMSHEMRTPIAGTLGLASLLEQQPLPEDSQEIVRLMKVAGGQLLGLINDILDLTRAERGQLDLNPQLVDPGQIARDALALVRAEANVKSLSLDFETADDLPAQVSVDSLRVGQVLYQLLANAVKFTPRGRILLRVENLAGGLTPLLGFTVEDQGIGFDAEAFSASSGPFVQGDSANSRSFGGTGLGIPLVRRLVDLLGGTIQFTSARGAGTQVTVRVPFAGSGRGASPAILPAEPADLSHLRVLVAEDNLVNRVIASRFLEKLGIQPALAADGLEAVEAAASTPFDVIFMDIQMPRLDGIEATRRIRATAPYQPVIIALSAHAFPEDRDLCLTAGMNDFLPKPLQMQSLRQRLEQVTMRRAEFPSPVERRPALALGSERESGSRPL